MNAHAGPPRPFFSSLASALLRLPGRLWSLLLSLPGRLWSLPRHLLSFVRRNLLPMAVGTVAAVLMVLGLTHLPQLHPGTDALPAASTLMLGALTWVFYGMSVNAILLWEPYPPLPRGTDPDLVRAARRQLDSGAPGPDPGVNEAARRMADQLPPRSRGIGS